MRHFTHVYNIRVHNDCWKKSFNFVKKSVTDCDENLRYGKTLF